MGVIELNRELAMEVSDRQILAFQDAEHVLQRAGHKKDLLTQP